MKIGFLSMFLLFLLMGWSINLMGCSINDGDSKITNESMSTNIDSRKEEQTTQHVDYIPGKTSLETVFALTEKWLEKEEGLTPLQDDDGSSLPWLSSAFMDKYVKNMTVKRLANGGYIIVINTVDISDNEEYLNYVNSQVEEFGAANNMEYKVIADNVVTEIFISKEHLSEVVSAYLKSLTGEKPEN